jgi:DNA replication protein DnaC
MNTPGIKPNSNASLILGEREALLAAAVRTHCRELRIPTVAVQCLPLSQAAAREGTTHLAFLEALLADEVQERCGHAVANRLRDARLPRLKTLEEFDFTAAAGVNAPLVRTLADGAYIERGEPVLLLGDCGTGKTHLACAWRLAANANGPVSPQPPHWSMNWSKPSTPMGLPVSCEAGASWT